MLHRLLTAETSGSPPRTESVLQKLLPCDQTALRRLNASYEKRTPAAILIGDGNVRAGQVIDTFLAGLDDETCVARITKPCSSAKECMQAVIVSVGFDPKELGLADLEKIFLLFLNYQKAHAVRTVICIEDAQDCDPWVFSKITELAELEARKKFGLFIVVSGRREMQDYLQQRPLRALEKNAGRHISVSPLALSETQEIISQEIQAQGAADISEVFNFEAIARLHEISAGVADTFNGLYVKSLYLAATGGGYPITADAVSKAASKSGLIADEPPDLSADTIEIESSVGSDAHCFGKLFASWGENSMFERAIDSDCISIGRDSKNDFRIPSLSVSRHHVLVVTSADGVKIMDLGSTNGTFVNDCKVTSHVLEDGDRIKLGDCNIEYISAGRRLAARASASAITSGDRCESAISSVSTQVARR